MSKKVLMMLAVLTVCAGVMVGCSKGNGKEDAKATGGIMQGEVM